MSYKHFLVGVVIGLACTMSTIANAGQQWNNGGGNGGNWNHPGWNNGGGGNWNRPPPPQNWNRGWNNGWNGNRTTWNVNVNAGWWGVGVGNAWYGGCCWGPTYVAPPVIYMQSAPVVYVQPSIQQRLMQVDVLLSQGQITPEQAATARANILNGQ